jgi:hypothetical protein
MWMDARTDNPGAMWLPNWITHLNLILDLLLQMLIWSFKSVSCPLQLYF